MSIYNHIFLDDNNLFCVCMLISVQLIISGLYCYLTIVYIFIYMCVYTRLWRGMVIGYVDIVTM